MDHEVRSPRRNGDRIWVKIVNMWPLIVALVSVIAMATTVKNTVDQHEIRITRLENGLSQIQNDTDRLVAELLDKK